MPAPRFEKPCCWIFSTPQEHSPQTKSSGAFAAIACTGARVVLRKTFYCLRTPHSCFVHFFLASLNGVCNVNTQGSSHRARGFMPFSSCSCRPNSCCSIMPIYSTRRINELWHPTKMSWLSWVDIAARIRAGWPKSRDSIPDRDEAKRFLSKQC
jgi:hypothetical protein